MVWLKGYDADQYGPQMEPVPAWDSMGIPEYTLLTLRILLFGSDCCYPTEASFLPTEIESIDVGEYHQEMISRLTQARDNNLYTIPCPLL